MSFSREVRGGRPERSEVYTLGGILEVSLPSLSRHETKTATRETRILVTRGSIRAVES